MIIFDNTSFAFIRKTEGMLREILSEIGIRVNRNRFSYNQYLYPINVVVFEGMEWGHFSPAFLQISLNRKLIALAKDSVVRDILRHELAHYLTFIKHGEVSPHGQEFRKLCNDYGFPLDVASATMNLEMSNEKKEGDLSSEKILHKVQKLFQLAQSSNSYEAELATLKANQILLRHSMEYSQSSEEPLYIDRLLMRKRKDAKLVSIYDILRHFIVRPVISSGRNACCLEVTGTLTNVRLAKYVAEFLDREFDHLWNQARKEHHLQGVRAKNSFFLGIAKGYNQKMADSKKSYSTSEQKALIVIEKNLDEKVGLIYRSLRQTSSGHLSDVRANSLGDKYGKELNIRQGVESSNKGLLLSFFKQG